MTTLGSRGSRWRSRTRAPGCPFQGLHVPVGSRGWRRFPCTWARLCEACSAPGWEPTPSLAYSLGLCTLERQMQVTNAGSHPTRAMWRPVGGSRSREEAPAAVSTVACAARGHCSSAEGIRYILKERSSQIQRTMVSAVRIPLHVTPSFSVSSS